MYKNKFINIYLKITCMRMNEKCIDVISNYTSYSLTELVQRDFIQFIF